MCKIFFSLLIPLFHEEQILLMLSFNMVTAVRFLLVSCDIAVIISDTVILQAAGLSLTAAKFGLMLLLL